MPHPGTHIAVVQLLAASTDPADAALAALLGGAQTNLADGGANADAVVRNRYACLGAIGPDLFYFLLDSSDKRQETQETVIRFLATFQAIDDIAAQMTRLARDAADGADTLNCDVLFGVGLQTVLGVLDVASASVKTLGTLAAGLWIDKKGLNLFSLLDSPRQAGDAPDRWYWADHLHYQRTGVFTRQLLDLALTDPKYRNEPALGAYAAGYFTHYVADTIGHPYVNAIVGGPYRLHRQRHTLVENFIDNVVWRSSFVSGQPGSSPFNPLTARPWVDRVRTAATPKGAAASSFYRSRVHQMIDVGGAGQSLDQGVSDFLAKVAAGFEQVNTDVQASALDFASDALFDKWCDLLVDALHRTYDVPGVEHPRRVNLDNNGFLRRADVKIAYATCYALLKLATTDAVPEPVAPDFGTVGDALKDAWEKLKKKAGDALDKIFSAPHLPSGGSFSLSAAWDALTDWVGRVVEGVRQLIGAVGDLLAGLCAEFKNLNRQVVQLAIWVIQSGLRQAYHAVRRMLEMRAYAQPADDTADAFPQLWRAGADAAGGNVAGRRRAYPVMERREAPDFPPFPKPGAITTPWSQDQLFCGIEPALHPLADQPTGIERPAIAAVTVHQPVTANPLFELFWAQPAANDASDMFSAKAQAVPANGPDTGGRQSFAPPAGLDFGGIVPNCRKGLNTMLGRLAKGASSVEGGGFVLPDYNLDGDRGGGFPAWRLTGGKLRVDNGEAAVDVAAWVIP